MDIFFAFWLLRKQQSFQFSFSQTSAPHQHFDNGLVKLPGFFLESPWVNFEFCLHLFLLCWVTQRALATAPLIWPVAIRSYVMSSLFLLDYQLVWDCCQEICQIKTLPAVRCRYLIHQNVYSCISCEERSLSCCLPKLSVWWCHFLGIGFPFSPLTCYGQL